MSPVETQSPHPPSGRKEKQFPQAPKAQPTTEVQQPPQPSRKKDKQHPPKWSSQKPVEPKIRLSRREFLALGGALTIVALGGIIIYVSRGVEESDIYGTNPEAGVDRKLLKQLLDMEINFRQTDLSDQKARAEHLDLCAEAFSRYAGETMPKDKLVSSVVWLPRPEYDRKVDKVSSGTTDPSGTIYIAEKSAMFDPVLGQKLRQQIPWWSTLTAARLKYTHEWFHLAGVTNEVTQTPTRVDKYFSQPMELYRTRGFAMDIRTPDSKMFGSELSLEETFAYAMNSRFEKRLTGLQFVENRSEQLVGEAATIVNRGVDRLTTLYSRRPDWVPVSQDYHRRSDPLGFGVFLADHSGYTFKSPEEHDQYARDLLFSICLEPQGTVINDFLSGFPTPTTKK